MDPDLLLLENQICFRIYTLERALMAVYKPYLEKLGVTYLQYLVLLILWEKKEATIGEICKALGLDTGTISPLIKRMEKIALLTRCRSQDDERIVRVALTEVGVRLQKRATVIPAQIGACLFGTSLEEYKQLREVLDIASERLKASSCIDKSDT